MRAPIIIALLINIIVIISATIYALLGILGYATVSIFLFLIWLAALLFFNSLFIYLFWKNRGDFNYEHQALVILWGGISTWYWSFAPIYYLLNMNLDELQLAWVMFAYFWEVPIIGGGLFVFISYLFFRPFGRYLSGKTKIGNPEKFLNRIFSLPLKIAILIFGVAVVGYIIGTLQLKYFAYLSFVEQIKNVLNGVSISVFIAIALYLVFDYFLSPVRAKFQKDFGKPKKTRRKIFYKIFIASTFLAIGISMMISLMVFKSFQEILFEEAESVLSGNSSELNLRLSSVAGFTERKSILESYKGLYNTRSFYLEEEEEEEIPYISLLSEDTLSFVRRGESGFERDFKNELRLVGLFEGPFEGEKIISVFEIKELYVRTTQYIYQFIIGLLFAVSLTILLGLLISVFLTRSIGKITNHLRLNPKESLEDNPILYTGDDIEDLFHAISGYIEEARNSQAILQEKVDDATLELSARVEESEESKKAMENVLEDLGSARDKLELAQIEDEAILSSVGVALLSTDEYGKITKANGEMISISGLGKDEIIGKWIHDALPLIDLKKGIKIDSEDSPTTESLTSGRPVSGNYKIINKYKGEIPIFINASPIKVGDRPIGIVLIVRDITVEQEIDKVKTEFVSLASHQLRTPLSAVKWYSEMLLAGDAGEITETQKRYLDEVYNSNERMIELVGALLDVSRLELGTFSVEPENILITDIAEDLIKENEHLIDKKNIKFKTDFDKDLAPAMLDKKLIGIIIQNLLSNALKYTPNGGSVSLDIKLVAIVNKKIEKGKDQILIKVSDSGYGIPKSQQSKIFTKLFRADNVRSKDTEGTGLGLYIVKSILETAGGDIWFDSVENEGSTFYVIIPVTGMAGKKGSRRLGE
ncbi:MAG TPA: ATP-binding protein [Candidatus Paceibacterota bacterium]